jgi:predicted small lipoprotein YifL
MKKSLLAALVAAFLLSSVVGCGDAPKSGGGSTPPKTGGTTPPATTK